MKQRPLILILFLLFALTPVFAQETNVSPAKWNRIETADKEFSAALPPNLLIDAEDRQYGQKLRIVAFQNGVELEVRIIKDPTAKDRLQNIQPVSGGKINTYKFGDFSILQTESFSPLKKFDSTFWILKKNTLYSLKINAPTAQEAELSRFLYSVKLQGKPLFVQKEKVELPEELIEIGALKTSPEIIEAFERKIEKNKINITYEVASEDLNKTEIQGLTRKVVIVDRPFPALAAGFQNGLNGTFSAKLKVNFLANGQIGDIAVLSVENKDFSKACVEAARKIRFVPAQVKGKNADSVEIVDYTVQVFSFPGTLIRR